MASPVKLREKDLLSDEKSQAEPAQQSDENRQTMRTGQQFCCQERLERRYKVYIGLFMISKVTRMLLDLTGNQKEPRFRNKGHGDKDLAETKKTSLCSFSEDYFQWLMGFMS